MQFRRRIGRIPSEACVLLPARSRPWQARGDALVARGPGQAAAILRRGQRRSQVGQPMSVNFEELDFRPTPMGVLSLRRRRLPGTDIDIYEIKLGDEYLMSSRFTVAEIELARLGLAALPRENLDVVVGGLGLGYTAQAALENPRVRSLIVVDALAEVIEWHEQGLLPLGKQLTGDPRCRLVNGDFFAMSGSAGGFDPDCAGAPLRCGAGGHRSLAAKPAASAPRRAVRARGACAAGRTSQSRRRVRAVVERSAGCGVQRGARQRLCNIRRACRDLRQFVRGSRRQQHRLYRHQGRLARLLDLVVGRGEIGQRDRNGDGFLAEVLERDFQLLARFQGGQQVGRDRRSRRSSPGSRRSGSAGRSPCRHRPGVWRRPAD